MNLTERELQDLAKAIQAGPTELLEMTCSKGTKYTEARSAILFNALNAVRYKIVPQPKLRTRTRKEWEQYCIEEGGWVKEKGSGVLHHIHTVGSGLCMVGRNPLIYDYVESKYTKPDGSTLEVEDAD